MKKYKFMQVDAFTNKRLGGNPCAILFGTDEMDPSTMLAVAKEMNLSETSFVRSSKVADYGVRYFTPAEEIPLAGHPTIATVHALVETGMINLMGKDTPVSLELQVGPIQVEVLTSDGGGQQIMMRQQKPKFLQVYDPAMIMPVFGLKPDDVREGTPIQTVSTGTPQLMVPVKNLEALKKAQVDIQAYQDLRDRSDFFSPHLFVLQGVERGDTFARHFGVPPDTPEDPFTGSATGGMAAYLWHYGLIQEPVFTAEQGHWMQRPGLAAVEVIGSRQDIEAVKVGGSAVTVLTGELTI